MTAPRKINRTELAIYAEGTAFTTDSLVRTYGGYVQVEEEHGREPDDEGRWAERQEWLVPCVIDERAADADAQ